MRLESMRGHLSLKFGIAVALVLVLAFGGALGATKGADKNRLDSGIQLVQEDAEDLEESEGGEGGEGAEGGEGTESGEYPPELGEGAEGGEGAESGEGAENGEGTESGEGTEGGGGGEPGPGDQITVEGATPNRTFANAQVVDSQGNVFNLGGGTADEDGNVTFTIPAGAASGDATLRLVGGGPGGTEEIPFEVATNRVESTMVSLSIGTAILLALGGILFAVVRRRRGNSVV